MSVAFHGLEVTAVVRETDECSSFELGVPSGLEDAYRYKAGQHLTFEIPWEGFAVTRCYSLSSCPDRGETLKIAVKRVEGGRVSNWMNESLSVGDTIESTASISIDPQRLSITDQIDFDMPEGGVNIRYPFTPMEKEELMLRYKLPAALAFAFYTVANLAPRASAHLSWYRERFPDYPRQRKALIPYLW